jgi:hypothetical protein
MLELLLIDLALCAPGIMVAASVMVTRRRRSSDQPWMPVTERCGAVAELADEGMAQRETVDVPGLSHDTVERDLGANVPAEPEPEPEPEPEQAAESPVSGVADPEPGPNGPGTEPDEQQAAADAVTSSERIASYYDEADRPMADYLAARGWAEAGVRPEEEPAPRGGQATALATALDSWAQDRLGPYLGPHWPLV